MTDLRVSGIHFMLPMVDWLQALILRVQKRLRRRQLRHLISCKVDGTNCSKYAKGKYGHCHVVVFELALLKCRLVAALKSTVLPLESIFMTSVRTRGSDLIVSTFSVCSRRNCIYTSGHELVVYGFHRVTATAAIADFTGIGFTTISCIR